MVSKRISQILIIAGAALLLAACGLFIYNKVFDYRAGRDAQLLLDSMLEEYGWDLPPISEMVYTPSSEVPKAEPDKPVEVVPDVTPQAPEPDPEVEATEDEDEEEATSPEVAPVPYIPTYTTLGVLTIPKLNVRLPVISECTDAYLRISCCRISGLANNKPIRLVIVGHNIWSHFKGLDTFVEGDQIAFTDKEGTTYFYGATEFEDVYKTNGAEVLAAEGWDITLITCKTDNTWRTVVRFAELTE